MYNQFSTVLLDIDLDFLCSEDRGWHGVISRHTTDMRATVPGKTFGQALRRFKKKGTKVYLIIDHQESLYWWDQHDVSDALCIHIDGHHDMWPNYLPRNVEVGHRANVDCGCYLHQAIRDNIVSKVLYVPALYRSVREETVDVRMNLNTSMSYRAACSKASVRSWHHFLDNRTKMPKADIITVAISPEWMPRHLWPEIEAFCEQMRIHPDLVRSKRRVANRKWNQLVKYNDCSSFTFPYKHRRS